MDKGDTVMGVFMKNLKSLADYAVSFVRWVVVAVLVGGMGGVLGGIFHICIDKATELRGNFWYLLLFMPVGGIFIKLMYRLFKREDRIDTNLVIKSLRENNKIPFVMIPLIFISTVVTQLVGGSAGREGAALQLGGSIGYNAGQLLKLDSNNMRIIIMSGMSSVFSALFGTPLTAAVFSLEVASVGLLDYTALLPCVVSATAANAVAGAMGIMPVRFEIPDFAADLLPTMLKVAVLSVLCALLSIVFCFAVEKCSHIAKTKFSSPYIRTLSLSIVLVAATLLLGTYDYNGAGMHVIERAMTGEAQPFAFALKIAFTAITLAAGFKGGEIVPAFFVGSTFGCVMAPLLGLDPVLGAAIGFVALFCGVVNCPIASILLSVEVFGTSGLLLFAVSCAISYMLSGPFGLYTSQKIVYSKANNEYIEQ